jgi:hypothetical protein
MSIELQPIVQRISTEYNPAGIAKFLGDLGSVKGIATAAIAGIAAIGGAIAVSVDKTIAWGKQLDDTMKLLGLTSKQAAGLGLMAKAAGVDISTLTRGLDIMGKNLITAQGGFGTAGRELERMGIQLYDTNGHLKLTPDLLVEVADKMADMQDGTEKTRLEMLLFGRSGT